MQQDNFVKKVDALFRARRKSALIACGLSLVLLVTIAQSENEAIGRWQVLFVVLSAVLTATVIYYVFTFFGAIIHLHKSVWDMFIEHNNFKELQKTDRSVQGVLSALGDTMTQETKLEGYLDNLHIRVLKLSYDFISKNIFRMKDSVQGNYYVLEIITNKYFYHVFMDSNQNNQFMSPSMRILHASINKNRKLSVEGDVDNYFDIYVPPDSTFHGLITLTPDVLIDIRDIGKAFDIEFIGNSIYIISDTRLRSTKDVLLYQRAIVSLVSKIGNEFASTQPAIEQPMKINKRPTQF